MCGDWYSSTYYGVSPENNPTVPSTGSNRLVRGGNWYNDAHLAHVAYRFWGDPSHYIIQNGFRLACSSE